MTWPQTCAGLLLVGGLSGRPVGPTYHPPQVPVPATWSEAQPRAAEAHTAMTQWWTTFKDPVLASRIARAVQSNWDLRTAAARVREARAQRGVVAADLWPSINVSAAYTQQRRSEHVPSLSPQVEQYLFQSGFDASWEIDLFGGVRRSIEAANAGIAAAQEGLRDTLVSLLRGLGTFLNVLDSERALFSSESDLAQSEATVSTDVVALYKALGGGWETLAPAP
jgi:outer membrane protein, multidrug efflux system